MSMTEKAVEIMHKKASELPEYSETTRPDTYFKRGFRRGYQQAEKDLTLTSDDINDIIRIYEDVLETESGENIYIEALNRFNKQKEYGKV